MTQVFKYQDGQLSADGVPLSRVAQQYGTPCFVYSRKAIEENWCAFDRAFGAHNHLICYAVKANSNLAILNLLARLGSGFDIVSLGELKRVIQAGGDPGKVVFSGVGKRTEEMREALKAGIKCFNVESLPELERLNRIAHEMKQLAPVSLRVNPDVDANTHPYVATGLKENKFGIPWEDALESYKAASTMDAVQVTGIDCHIGSQIISVEPFLNALEKVLILKQQLEAEGLTVEHIDIGGGLGIDYQDESVPTACEFVDTLLEVMQTDHCQIIIEPGRSIIGNAGVLLTQVEYIKKTSHKNFAVVDAAMNDLLRPSLYEAWHNILPLTEMKEGGEVYDIVGPVCETGDFLGKNRAIRIREGDFLAICSAGAYGFSMSSNYNSRPRPCEIMIDDGELYEIRKREKLSDLYGGESQLP